ncbi:PAS domain S-box protein [Geobacter grbiciae]|nr:PAS domain S-box protein [Geobacter grbiciae]
MPSGCPAMSEHQPQTSGTITARVPDGPAAELAQLKEENARLRARLASKSDYIRRKVDQMLTVMGTRPLRQEELDDNTLIDVDPLGILVDSFAHILDHLHTTNRELTENRELLQTIFSSLESGILLIREEDHVITDVNETACRSLGLKREDILGQLCFSFIYPDCTGACPMKEQNLKIDNSERMLRAADGHIVPVLKTVGRVMVHGIPHFLESFIDITAQKEAEAEILALNEDLEMRVQERTAELIQANREMESFSYSISHDLRAPLRHINGYINILREDYGGHLDMAGINCLQRVDAASKQMGMLIDDLLSFSRIPRTLKNPQTVDLSQLARDVTVMLRETEPDRQVEVEIQDGLVAHGDVSLLNMVVQNLIGNAWKFTARSSRAAISFGRKRQGERDVFFVLDNGVGFDMTYQNKLFKVFERLNGEEFEGTGIGLAIVKRIVNRHGGDIWAESSPGNGATFYFTLASPRQP